MSSENWWMLWYCRGVLRRSCSRDAMVPKSMGFLLVAAPAGEATDMEAGAGPPGW